MNHDNVRERILREATRLFGTNGFGATSVREVVEAAGVTKPTLYYHFGSKEGLFLAAVDVHMHMLASLVDEVTELPGSAEERLREFARRYVLGATENPESVRFLLTLKHRPDPDSSVPPVDLLRVHLHHAERLGAMIGEGIAAGELKQNVTPAVAVRAFLGIVNLAVMAAFHGTPTNASDVDELVDIFLHGVARR